jgi:hypothetical protein
MKKHLAVFVTMAAVAVAGCDGSGADEPTWDSHAYGNLEGDGKDIAKSCSAKDECSKGEYCSFDKGAYPVQACGANEAAGTCRPMPESCTSVCVPVCGCDGATYDNACRALQAGTDYFSRGPCETLDEYCAP